MPTDVDEQLKCPCSGCQELREIHASHLATHRQSCSGEVHRFDLSDVIAEWRCMQCDLIVAKISLGPIGEKGPA